MKQNKRIKVYRKFRNTGGIYRNNRVLPWISISSVWLEKYGFNVGDYIDLTVERNKIMISKSAKDDCSKTDQNKK